MLRRGRLRAPVSFLVVTSLGVFAAAQVPAFAGSSPAAAAAPVTNSTPTVTQACSTPTAKGVDRCFALRVDPVKGAASVKGLMAAAAPAGLSPSDLTSAYKLPANGGAGATIAVVDAYDDPNAAADLAMYRQQYGLPALNSGQFIKVNQRGTQGDYPVADEGWSAEISLDLDMISAAAPKADIILVEADSANGDSLGASVNEAVALGAGYVSNSYGSAYTSTPGSGESSTDPQSSQEYYDHPGVAIVAASGDSAYGVSFPAASPYVTSVGGTSLARDASTARGWSESVWNSGGHAPGSGCSTVEPKPAFQHDTECAGRTVADVSAVADPRTGVAVYDSYGPDSTGWAVYGGTSAATPIIASVYADAGPIAAGSAPNSYPYAHTDAINDVTSGSDGTCAPAYLCTAGPGYDGPTGLGTPNGTAAFASGPTGTLSGTITDAASGKPVAGAKITASGGSGASDSATITGPDGTFAMPLTPGSYRLAVSAFDYRATTAPSVTITANATSATSVSLTKLPEVTVSGTVADASGHGWPLYASIQVDNGIPGSPFYTDPKTGKYSIQLPDDGTYTLHTASNYAGYADQDVTVTTQSTDKVQNIGLAADTFASLGVPPGYTQHSTGDTETFPDKTQPAGWSVQTAMGAAWSFDSPLADQTGSPDGFVGVDTEYAPTDTSLLTPVVNVPASQTPFVSFISAGSGGTAEVDYSTDGGKTWTVGTSREATEEAGAELLTVPASPKPIALQIKFRYVANTATTSYGSDWQLTDVRIGGSWVTPQPGGLVVGNIKDGNTSGALDGAAVSVDGVAAQSGISTTMPGVAGRTDGFYYFFSSATGKHPVTASLYQYKSVSTKVPLAADKVAVVDFTLPTGRLVTSGALSATVSRQGTATRDLTLSNTGDAPLTVKLEPFAGSATATGAPLQLVPIAPADRAAAISGLFKNTQKNAPLFAGGTGQRPDAGTPATGPGWASAADIPSQAEAMVAGTSNGILYAGLGSGNELFTLNTFYAYNPATGTWTQKASAPYSASGAAGGFIGGKFYTEGGLSLSSDYELSQENTTQIYDPATDTWTTGAVNPNATFGGGSGVLGGKLYIVGGDTPTGQPVTTVSVYDPRTNTWGTAASYPSPIMDESCGAIAGKLYCAGGVDALGGNQPTEAFVYNPADNSWKRIADLPIGLAASASSTADGQLLISGGYTGAAGDATNQGFAYDPAMNWWTPLPNAPLARIWATGALGFYSIGGTQDAFSAALGTVSQLTGYGQTDPVRLPWLSADPTSVTIQPGHHVTVHVRLDACGSGLSRPGTDTAAFGFETDSPYAVAPVAVSMTVR
jgi:hypothetical protein